ncbi:MULTISPECIES: Fur family transcriptional regulator [Methanobacterium]|jgi:Fe2+ or Zn2+ uptake regulation protein|uniref:Fur family transcriptional regulator n=1 Tax=Methanobacterium TaxID=2160 RepID=UPI002412905E|nr:MULTISPECIES: transcriptional repressor [Methanobacterium]MDG3548118.1 transcriptional repressor [Methanobacterium formicicum]
MEEKLKEEKIKITPQRREIIRRLEELEKTHPSFNQIYQSIKETQPNVSRSTVHDNLKLLVERGIIRSFNYKGETRYEMSQEPHVNLAEFNKNITDIKNEKINKMLDEIVHILNEEEGIEIKSLLVLVEK